MNMQRPIRRRNNVTHSENLIRNFWMEKPERPQEWVWWASGRVELSLSSLVLSVTPYLLSTCRCLCVSAIRLSLLHLLQHFFMNSSSDKPQWESYSLFWYSGIAISTSTIFRRWHFPFALLTCHELSLLDNESETEKLWVEWNFDCRFSSPWEFLLIQFFFLPLKNVWKSSSKKFQTWRIQGV